MEIFLFEQGESGLTEKSLDSSATGGYLIRRM